jgi:hypothetical protein
LDDYGAGGGGFEAGLVGGGVFDCVSAGLGGVDGDLVGRRRCSAVDDCLDAEVEVGLWRIG